MASEWMEARNPQGHRLYGIGGWLIVFAVGLALGPLKELGVLNEEASRAGITLGTLLSIDHPSIRFAKSALALQVLILAIAYLLMAIKHSKFRNVVSLALLASWPVLLVVAIADPGEGVVNAMGLGFFQWAIGCSVWVTYLQRSRRVRVTFEHLVRAENTAASSAQAQPTSAAASGAQATHVVAVHLDPSYDEAPWEQAQAEVDGCGRRPGLWAKCFSEADGNEASAKARYLKYRVEQIQTQSRANAVKADAARVELETKARAERDLVDLEGTAQGICPQCDRAIPLASVNCPHCPARFGANSLWSVIPMKLAGRRTPDLFEINVKGDASTTTDENGTCPQCEKLIPMSSLRCPHCPASFARGSRWAVVPVKAS